MSEGVVKQPNYEKSAAVNLEQRRSVVL